MDEARLRVASGEVIRRYIYRFLSILFLATILATVAMSLGTVHAQGADSRESITMSPTNSQYTTSISGVINDKLTIVNDSKTAYDFIVYARPYSVNNNEYNNPDFMTLAKSADLYAWVQFPQTKFHAEPNTTTYVNYSINVPANASPGGHYGVIFAEVQPLVAEGSGNQIIRKKRVGSIVYMTVNGEVKLSGEIGAGSIPFWQVQPPLHTTVVAKNTGNTHFTSNAILSVHDIFGNLKYQSRKNYFVLPNTVRTMDLNWDKAPWFGLFKASTEQTFLGKTYKSEGYVLLMPRYLPVALILVIVIGGVYALARRRKN
ncbi:MAG: hypothetical protein QG549_988 [Patescibacteria group bacterium]|nr:hypothetical protein [Patescibacteria group bacterium]